MRFGLASLLLAQLSIGVTLAAVSLPRQSISERGEVIVNEKRTLCKIFGCAAGQYCTLSGLCATCGDGYGIIPGILKRTHGWHYGDNNNKCTQCAAGTYSPSGSLNCNSCPAGQYCPSPGTKTPTPCPAGKYSSAGASSCTSCPVNTYASSSGTANSCSPCPAGERATWLGSTVCEKISCNPGQSYRDGACSNCPAGQFSDGKSPCQPCRGGSTSQAGAATCTTCPAGTWLVNNACAQCPAGRYCWPDTTNPDYCPAGSFSAAGAHECTHCPPNTYSSTIGTKDRCSACPSTQVASQDRTRCIPVSTMGLSHSRRSMVCNNGLTACAIGGSLKARAFECVDIMTDIQSCGGCWSTGAGEDCTAFDDRASATCVQGKCQYTCPSGWQLTALGCAQVPARPDEETNSTSVPKTWTIQHSRMQKQG